VNEAISNAIAALGLPAWAILVIGAGTIVAAIITALQAIVVAAINARATRLNAIDMAHREHRLSLTKPILAHVRGCTSLTFQVSGGAAATADEMIVQSKVWLQSLQEIAPRARTWVTDAELSVALDFFGKRLRAFEQALMNLAKSSASIDFSSVEQAARGLQKASEVTEMAVEGYAFGVSRISRQAKRRLQRYMRTRWVTLRNQRYTYWPLSVASSQLKERLKRRP
jgi:hypothetical protein